MISTTIQNTKYKIQNAKYKIQNTKYKREGGSGLFSNEGGNMKGNTKLPNDKYNNAKYKIQNAKCKI